MGEHGRCMIAILPPRGSTDLPVGSKKPFAACRSVKRRVDGVICRASHDDGHCQKCLVDRLNALNAARSPWLGVACPVGVGILTDHNLLIRGGKVEAFSMPMAHM